MKNFETLKKAYPIFEVRNRQSLSKNILLRNNEEVVVPGNATVKIASEDLIQMPDSTFFKVVSPSVDALIEHNVLKKSEPETTKKDSKTEKGSESQAGSSKNS